MWALESGKLGFKFWLCQLLALTWGKLSKSLGLCFFISKMEML